ncbi:MAG TPA: UDP-N-acetylglucosamine 2-epimerase (non-hydrolyzing), partial [Candidatus Aminicenantes bacterium]|nr:UDP-N-acetylglucosamine 2-epimerase (non-hydrolyzing) [Candidatus Aminicenantes bacterium]
MKQNVTVIFGTRPELIKLAPVIHRLRQFPDDFAPFLLATAQHRQMLDQVLSLFDLTPDRDLDLMVPNQTLDGLSARVMSSVSDIYREHKPDVVVVQGDTTTAMVAALAAFYQRIPVAHVEAGLRTGDIFNPFPEEVNRRVIGSLATFHFPPTVQAGEALEREGVPAERVLVTGNTVVDALQMISPALDRVPLPLALPADRRFVLVTAHRRENFGEPMENICGA